MLVRCLLLFSPSPSGLAPPRRFFHIKGRCSSLSSIVSSYLSTTLPPPLPRPLPSALSPIPSCLLRRRLGRGRGLSPNHGPILPTLTRLNPTNLPDGLVLRCDLIVGIVLRATLVLLDLAAGCSCDTAPTNSKPIVSRPVVGLTYCWPRAPTADLFGCHDATLMIVT